MKLCVILLAVYIGFVAAQTNEKAKQGQQQWVYTYETPEEETPQVEDTPTYTYEYVEEEKPEEEEVTPVAIELPKVAELKEMISKKIITADYLNGLEKNRISLVCTCKGSFKDGDNFNIDHLFKGSENPEETCAEICAEIKKQTKQQSRVKRQLGLFGWNAYPNYGFGGYFGGLPIGYGGLGFNLMGAWAGLGGANYGCVANGCGGFGGCHFGCARSWLPAPLPVRLPVAAPMPIPAPIVREVPVARPVPVPVAKPVAVPVPRPVNVPVYRPVDVPVPRPVNVPRPVDVPVPRRVDIPVVRQINVARPVPVPLPVVKPVTVAVAKPVAVAVPQPVAVAVPKPVAIPVQRRLIVKKRLLYRPAVARVSGVALVPVQGVAMNRQRLAASSGIGANAIISNLAGGYGRSLGGYGTYSGYGGIPVPGPGAASAGGGYYTSGASSYQYPKAAATN